MFRFAMKYAYLRYDFLGLRILRSMSITRSFRLGIDPTFGWQPRSIHLRRYAYQVYRGDLSTVDGSQAGLIVD